MIQPYIVTIVSVHEHEAFTRIISATSGYDAAYEACLKTFSGDSHVVDDITECGDRYAGLEDLEEVISEAYDTEFQIYVRKLHDA